MPFAFRGDFPCFAHSLQRMPVFPSTVTLCSHVKSFFHVGLSPLTLCFLTADCRAFLVTGLDSESSPLSSDELHDVSDDSTLDGALKELGALLLELKKPSIVRCCIDDIFLQLHVLAQYRAWALHTGPHPGNAIRCKAGCYSRRAETVFKGAG